MPSTVMAGFEATWWLNGNLGEWLGEPNAADVLSLSVPGNVNGYREYPKYGMVRRYFIYKQALLAEAGRLVRGGVLRAHDDIFFLTLHELHDVARTREADHDLIARRRDDLRAFADLTPPRVLTSRGEGFKGDHRRDDVPAGALAGRATHTRRRNQGLRRNPDL